MTHHDGILELACAATSEPQRLLTGPGLSKAILVGKSPTWQGLLGSVSNALGAIKDAVIVTVKVVRRFVVSLDSLQWFVVATILLIAALSLLDLALTLRADRQKHSDEFWKTWRGSQVASLRSLDSIWVMLVILQCLIVAAFLALLFTQAPEHWEAVFDYVGFAAPCFAAIVAGFGILRRVGEEYKRSAKARDVPRQDPDAIFYAVSIGFLYAAVVGYICAHFTLRLLALFSSSFVSLCAFAHLWLAERRARNARRAAIVIPSLLVSWFLVVLTIVAWFATISGYGALRKIDHCHEIAEESAKSASAADKPSDCLGIE